MEHAEDILRVPDSAFDGVRGLATAVEVLDDCAGSGLLGVWSMDKRKST